MGNRGAVEDSEKLQLTDKLLQAVLAESQVVCVGQPLLAAGDLNADPAVIHCLAKAFSYGKFVDLALAHLLGAGRKPDATCKFRLDECVGSRTDFNVGCPNALAASTACRVTDRWFTPHFSVVVGWTAEVSCPVATQPVWPACWIDTPDRSSSSSSVRIVQDAWDVYREKLCVVPPDLALTLRHAYDRSDVDGFWHAWSKGAEDGLFDLHVEPVGRLVLDAFLGRGCCSYSSAWSWWQVCKRWKRGLVLVGCAVLVKVVWFMPRLLC